MNRDQRENRGSWYLLTGLILGFVLGLLYTWTVEPVEYVNTTPASLRVDYKDRYRAMIAAAYQYNHDLVRAQARLELLNDDDMVRSLTEQAQRTLGEGGDQTQAGALGELAAALGVGSAGISSPEVRTPTHTPEATLTLTLQPNSTVTETSETPLDTDIPEAPQSETTLAVTATITRTPRPTATPSPTPTETPTRTPTSTPAAPFVLRTTQRLCEQNQPGGLIQVIALDAAEVQIAGVEVIVTWDGGEDHFYTGLQPEMGRGYADFDMTEGVVYAVRLAEAGETARELSTFTCSGGYPGSWRITFQQP